jgi:4-amino-4-deoxy-L-arabinose transferase-like glycosyltransferase
LLGTIWVQPSGSPLVEHDETRYAEIAREMLATGDFTVPHFNGVPWYEKPPLLFWAGATAMRVFGPTPWAARLPSRLAGLGTLCLLAWWVARHADRRRALLAAMVAAGTPLGWGIAFLNLTDGLLTFFVAVAILFGYGALRSSITRACAGRASVAGAAAGCAFLTKGLVGLLFPVAILGIWVLLSRRRERLFATAAAGSVAALAVVLPWVVTVAERCPEYLRYFIIREHFQRYASAIHTREQPVFFMVLVFAVGLAPVIGAFLSALLRRPLGLSEGEKLLVVWFAFVVLFFSFSRSQLVSYVAPAIPAASAFIAMRFGTARHRAWPWLVQAGVAAALVIAAASEPRSAVALLAPRSLASALAAGAILVATALVAALVARRDEWRALPISFAGYTALYVALLASLPTSGTAREMTALRQTIVHASLDAQASLVSYKTFVKGLPWLMQAPIPFVDPGGELAAGARTITDPESPLAWTEARFWQRWQASAPVMALIDERKVADFEARAGAIPFILARARRHLLVSNFELGATPSADPAVSTALYQVSADTTAVPIASVPERVIAGSRDQLKGAPIVRCFIERTLQGDVWEIASGGSRPRVVEVDVRGRVIYTEELVRVGELPMAVLAALEQHAAGATICYVRRERRGSGVPDHFEAVLSEGPTLLEIEIDALGQVKSELRRA